MTLRLALLAAILLAAFGAPTAVAQDTEEQAKALYTKWDAFERELRKYERSLQTIQSRYNGAPPAKRESIRDQYANLKRRAIREAKELVAEIDGFIKANPKHVGMRKRRLEDTVFSGLSPEIKAEDARVLYELTQDGTYVQKAAKLYEQAYMFDAAVRMWDLAVSRAASFDNLMNLGKAALNAVQIDKAKAAFDQAQKIADTRDRSREAQSMALTTAEYVTKWSREQELRKTTNNPIAEIVTDRGTMKVELFEDQAPNTVANFIELAEAGKYDGLTFHRNQAYFMIQGGDPEGTGNGGPGYRIKDEYNLPDARLHYPGTLSMANTGRPDTNGSQFFVTSVTSYWLNKKHTVFGRVLEGLKVAQVKPIDATNKARPFGIKSIRILRKRDHDYQAEKIQ